MKKLKNVHPGEILKLDFLDEMNITPYALAKAIGVDQTRISQLIKGSRSMSADTALRLGKFFNVSPEFWLNIQTRFDLEEEKEHNSEYNKISPFQIGMKKQRNRRNRILAANTAQLLECIPQGKIN